jgi:hypothetical protein
MTDEDDKDEAQKASEEAFNMGFELGRQHARANWMDAKDGPECFCGAPSSHESGWCGFCGTEGQARLTKIFSEYRTALAFARSVIKSGEPWTATCEEMIGKLLKD